MIRTIRNSWKVIFLAPLACHGFKGTHTNVSPAAPCLFIREVMDIHRAREKTRINSK